MAVLVMNLDDALKYTPQRETHVVSIRGTNPNIEHGSKELYDKLPRKLYHIFPYIFDDLDPVFKPEPGVMFTTDIARTIIFDFDANRRTCIDLLVHCMRGQNRSPAVAMALNDIFSLGEDTAQLRGKYFAYTTFVYDLMMEAAREFTPS